VNKKSPMLASLATTRSLRSPPVPGLLRGFIITGFKVHNGSSLPAALGMAGDGWG
jgi:hypothetical protein